MQAKAFFEPLRSLVYTGISGTYADIGPPTSNPIRAFKITNNTEGDLIFSATPAQDDMFVAAGTFTLYDVQSNVNPRLDDKYVLPEGTQFRVKQVTAPVSDSVYIECLC